MRLVFIFLMIVSVGAFALFGYFYSGKLSFNASKTEQIIQEKEQLEIFVKEMELLSKAWREGDTEGLWKNKKILCPKSLGDAFEVGDDYLKCNPRFILCLLEAKKLNLDFETLDYKLLVPANSHLANLPTASYLFELRLPKNKKVFPVLLEDTCHEVFLPERIYLQGKKEASFLWDNYGANIFIDKYPVSFFQVSDWLKNSKEKLSLPETQKGLSEYATNLTLEQMQAYCAFRGKQLLSSEIMDAASFYPADISNPNEEEIQNSPYPWTRKKNLVETEVRCQKFRSEECPKTKSFEPEALTWSGLTLSLGGPLEALFNPFERELNLKASSSYFPFGSSWHKLGERARWDGLDHDEKNFDWGTKPPRKKVDNYKVGFRCMRTVYRDERP